MGAAQREGADGVVVSNHGGRQLDGAPATIEILSEIVSVLDQHMTVLLDGGVRRGSDIVKALALGADAVSIGMAALMALSLSFKMLPAWRRDSTVRLVGWPATTATPTSRPSLAR